MREACRDNESICYCNCLHVEEEDGDRKSGFSTDQASTERGAPQPKFAATQTLGGTLRRGAGERRRRLSFDHLSLLSTLYYCIAHLTIICLRVCFIGQL
jgi:hypothetical protein